MAACPRWARFDIFRYPHPPHRAPRFSGPPGVITEDSTRRRKCAVGSRTGRLRRLVCHAGRLERAEIVGWRDVVPGVAVRPVDGHDRAPARFDAREEPLDEGVPFREVGLEPALSRRPGEGSPPDALRASPDGRFDHGPFPSALGEYGFKRRPFARPEVRGRHRLDRERTAGYDLWTFHRTMSVGV